VCVIRHNGFVHRATERMLGSGARARARGRIRPNVGNGCRFPAAQCFDYGAFGVRNDVYYCDTAKKTRLLLFKCCIMFFRRALEQARLCRERGAEAIRERVQ